MPDRRRTDADREVVASLVRGISPPAPSGAIELAMTPEQFADLLLAALTAEGRLRANAADDIESEIRGLHGYADDYLAGMRRAAVIARGDTDAG